MAHVNIFRITGKEQETIRGSFNKTDTEIEEYVQNLKDWIRKQRHLPQDEDDNRLKILLLFNKYSLEKTKKKLDTYYSVKNVIPEIYTDCEPLNSKVNAMLDAIMFCPLPALNHDMCRVHIFGFAACDTEQFDTTVFNRLFFAYLDLRMVSDPCLGDHYIADYCDIKLGHITKITPVYLKKTLTLLQKAYSDRIKGLHFLNLPPAATALVALINSIFSAKLANRVHIHEDLKSLHQHISKEILPIQYGGTYGNLDNIYEEWKSFFRSRNSWLVKEATRRSDESKRIGEPFDTELFGMYGSFRQIKVD